MSPEKPLLERAYELARSGSCAGLSDIRQKLKAEGYTAMESSMIGLGLRRELKKLCDQAQAAPRRAAPS